MTKELSFAHINQFCIALLVTALYVNKKDNYLCENELFGGYIFSLSGLLCNLVILMFV